ncbi:hypothetical protein [Marinagarivorans cellulosilyticus]|uniref:Uncharacterized protein n=1 Tax=Marinagarivorans cellulosilyticus TaxID=2721545 RepID=A0AAN2BIW8_9GAMM|nr:hypothetical protein [Marinagarivorans cellulosilyticus]BCD96348.1 hypothetical protein MARGE09_P0548 [Marinagarivorans cellulosilyticus]
MEQNPYIDGPYICTESIFSDYKIKARSLEFLAVNSVSSEMQSPLQWLTMGFSLGYIKGLEFESLVNLLCYSQGPSIYADPRRAGSLITRFVGQAVSGNKNIAMFGSLFSGLFYWLTIEARLPVQLYPLISPPASRFFIQSSWFTKFPDEVKHWMVATSVDRLKLFGEFADHELAKATIIWLENNEGRSKSYSNALAVVRHHFAFNGLKTIDLPRLANLLKGINTKTGHSRSLQPILNILSAVTAADPTLRERFAKLYEREFSISSVSRVYHPQLKALSEHLGLSGANSSARTAGGSVIGKRVQVRKTKALPRYLENELYGKLKLAANCALEGYAQYISEPVSALTIGDYSISLTLISGFKPNKIRVTKENKYWISLERDYLEYQQFEKYTTKSTLRRLAIFNVYMFSYLPWFKRKINQGLKIPSEVEDFNPNIFVRRSGFFVSKNDPSNILPCTLPEFISEVRSASADDNEGRRNNSIRDNYKTIFNMFEHAYHIGGDSRKRDNPLAAWRPIPGERYQVSKKNKLDYQYWVLFKEYSIRFSDACIQVMEDVDCNDIDQLAWRERMQKILDAQSFPFGDKKISFSSSPLDDLTISASKVHVFSAIVTLLSYCGIRFSNAFWLDVRSYNAASEIPNSNERLVPLNINTDKTQLRPYQSHIPMKVMRILDRLKNIRCKVLGDEIASAKVNYQNNANSKWPSVCPLFRYSTAFSEASAGLELSTMLTYILANFERLFDRCGVRLNSYIYPKISGMTFEEYEELKALRATSKVNSYVVEKADMKKDLDICPRPVTFFEYRSSITLHSFRKTLDSYYSNFVSHEMIGKLFTGQAASVVGYYAENTPDDFEDGVRLAKESGFPIPIPINTFTRDDKEVIAHIKDCGITQEYFRISAAPAEGFSIEDAYSRAPADKIAINRTHICPYDNDCPTDIRRMLDDQKLCGACPAAISVASDAPAIAATIKLLGDQICDLSKTLEKEALTSGERKNFFAKRMCLVAEFSAWLLRHETMRGMSHDQILLGETGEAHLRRVARYVSPHNLNPEIEILLRMLETSGVQTLQSETLQLRAKRLARKVISNITPEILDKIDSDPVEVAAQLIAKVAKLNGISLEEAVKTLEQSGNPWKQIRVGELVSLEGLNER